MKVACVYHSIDLDGWMSGAIVMHWFMAHHKNDVVVLNGPKGDDKVGYRVGPLSTAGNNNSITMFGYNYGEPVPDLSGYDKVIICDIAFPKEVMESLEFTLEYGNPEEENFIWIDHHISSMTDNTHRNYHGLRDVKFSACELTWKYFFPDKEMPEIVRLLGRYDCFGHKGTDEEQKVLEFQYGVRSVISNYEEAYKYLIESLSYSKQANWNHPNAYSPENSIWERGKSIYFYLCTEAKQSYQNGFVIEFDNPKWDTIEHYPGMPLKLKFICVNKERFNPINFGINYHADGYDGAACFNRRADGKWTFSLYNDNGLVDCSAIAKQFGGGGHKGAAGFIVNDVEQFLNKVL